MSAEVTKLIPKDQQRLDDVVGQFPGMRPTHDRYCEECNDFLRVGTPNCKGHTVRWLSAKENMAATIDVMWRYT